MKRNGYGQIASRLYQSTTIESTINNIACQDTAGRESVGQARPPAALVDLVGGQAGREEAPGGDGVWVSR